MAKLIRMHRKVNLPYGFDIKSGYAGTIQIDNEQYSMEFPTENEYYEYLREEEEEKLIM